MSDLDLRAPAVTGGRAEISPRFFLGAHQPVWLSDGQAELCVSDRQLRGRRTLPRAAAPWVLDSGAFSTLDRGEDFDPPKVYAVRARRYRDEIGSLLWIAQQDRMCEPFMLAKTGLTVARHQRLTAANYAELCQVAPDLGVLPVLQGWTVADYLRCLDLFAAPLSKGGAGVDLTTLPLVGLGSVCRRQSTRQAESIIIALRDAGVARLHGFGIKTLGLRRFGWRLASSDSMAWSYAARRAGRPLPGCTGHINCANCRRYAYAWYAEIAATAGAPGQVPAQLELFSMFAGRASAPGASGGDMLIGDTTPVTPATKMNRPGWHRTGSEALGIELKLRRG